MEKIKVFALGGLDECGKNMYIIEVGEDIYVVEAGHKYPDKTSPGVDVIIPDYNYLLENKSRIKAVIISHGHLDQMGAVPYLFKNDQIDAPIYASPLTIALIKMYTNSLGIENNYKFVSIKDSDSYVKVGNHNFRFFKVAHMIAGSLGFALETEQGSIVYTGEFIVENNNPNYSLDLASIAKIAEDKVLLLMAESRYADRPGYTSPGHRLTPHIAKDLKEAPGRTFVALYDSNVYGLLEVLKLALETNKKVLFYGQETKNVINTLNSVGELNIPKTNLLSNDDIFRVREQDVLIIILGNRDTLYNQIDLLANGEGEDKKIVLYENDTFIIVAPPQIGTEVYAVSVLDEVFRTGAHVVNVNKKKITSMHAQEEDIKTMLALLRPKYYMPIIGEYRHILANAKVAVSTNSGYTHLNTFVLDNGMVVDFENGRALPIKQMIKVGDLLVDGSGVGDVEEKVLTDRQKLAADGVVCMALTVSLSQKKVVAGPDVQMRGFVLVKDSETLLYGIADEFVAIITAELQKEEPNLDDAKQAVYEKTLRMVRRSTGKEPMILPLVIEIE